MFSEHESALSNAVLWLREISGVDELTAEDFGDNKLCVIDYFLHRWLPASQQGRTTTHGEKIRDLLTSAHFPWQNLTALDLTYEWSKSTFDFNTLEKSSTTFPAFLHLVRILSLIDKQPEKYPKVISFSVLPKLATAEASLQSQYEQYYSQMSAYATISRGLTYQEFKKEYLGSVHTIVAKMESLRNQGFVFVVTSSNTNLPDDDLIFQAQSIQVSGVLAVQGNKGPNKEIKLEESGKNSGMSDIISVGSWDSYSGVIDGNSFATPIVSLGVVMIEHAIPQVFELPKRTRFLFSRKPSLQQVRNLTELREHVILTILKNASVDRNIENQTLRVLDLSELKHILQRDGKKIGEAFQAAAAAIAESPTKIISLDPVLKLY